MKYKFEWVEFEVVTRTFFLIKEVYFSIGVFDWLFINKYEDFPTNGVDKSKWTFFILHPPLLCKLPTRTFCLLPQRIFWKKIYYVVLKVFLFKRLEIDLCNMYIRLVFTT